VGRRSAPRPADRVPGWDRAGSRASAAVGADQDGRGPGQHGQPDEGDDDQVRRDTDRGGREPACQGAEQAAAAEGGVQPGQQRPPGAGLHLDAQAVGRHVDRAGAGAEDQQRRAQRRHRARQAGQHRGEAERHSRHGADQAGTEPGAQRAGELHAGQRAEGQAQQGYAQRRVPGAGGHADVGDPGRPAAEDEPVEGEQDGDRGTQPAQRRQRCAQHPPGHRGRGPGAGRGTGRRREGPRTGEDSGTGQGRTTHEGPSRRGRGAGLTGGHQGVGRAHDLGRWTPRCQPLMSRGCLTRVREA
jgi:hypothetical protein